MHRYHELENTNLESLPPEAADAMRRWNLALAGFGLICFILLLAGVAPGLLR